MNEPAPARPSASVLLIRDGADGLEVFMVVRHHEIDFASGALVFPGGRLAEGDGDPALRALCDGAEAFDDYKLAMAVASIRESFEECGVLLARREGETGLIGAEALVELERYRGEFDSGALDMSAFLTDRKLRLACDLLVTYANWVTPAFVPKRFDTWFFLAAAPSDQVALHDGREAVDSEWIRPADAIADGNSGRRPLVFPTRLNLMRLAESNTAAAAIAAARDRPIVAVQPWLEERGEDKAICIPADSGYALSEVPMKVAAGGPWPDAPA